VNSTLWIWLIKLILVKLNNMNQETLIQELIKLKSQVTGTTAYAYGLLDGLTMAIETIEEIMSPA
jgi:hypothetical protein